MVKISDFFVGKVVEVNDKMQKGYKYTISEKFGEEASDFHKHDFYPQLSPEKMLKLGVFEGKYLNDCVNEFPEEWFAEAKVSGEFDKPNIENNYFKIKSRLSLSEWKKRGWIIGDDPRGWFQWYCRWTLGRRTNYDAKQIARWKSFKRHAGQVKKNCKKGDVKCRIKQRQGLLQWAYDSISDNF